MRTPLERHDDARPRRLRVVDRRAAAQRPVPPGVAVPRAGRADVRGRGAGPATPTVASVRASEPGCAAIGIVQRGAGPAAPARPGTSSCPREEAGRPRRGRPAAAPTLDRLEELHDFSKGVGLAAPQIGLAVAAAVVRPPDRGAEPVVLLNPRVVDESRGDRRAVRGLPVLLRLPRPGGPAAADRGGARPVRRHPGDHLLRARPWPGWSATRSTTSRAGCTSTGWPPGADPRCRSTEYPSQDRRTTAGAYWSRRHVAERVVLDADRRHLQLGQGPQGRLDHRAGAGDEEVVLVPRAVAGHAPRRCCPARRGTSGRRCTAVTTDSHG